MYILLVNDWMKSINSQKIGYGNENSKEDSGYDGNDNCSLKTDIWYIVE